MGAECMICHNTYAATTEVPLRLPCIHIVGSFSIFKWLSPEEMASNTCPYYRCEFSPSQREMDDEETESSSNLESGSDENDTPEVDNLRISDFDVNGDYQDIIDVAMVGNTQTHQNALLDVTPGERSMYIHLLQMGADFPPLADYQDDGRLDVPEREHLFLELERQGAFNIERLQAAKKFEDEET